MSEKCPNCGANMKAWWHTMSPKYIGTLIKILKRVREKKENHVVLSELGLTTNEYSNISKLRYFALIAKFRDDKQAAHNGWVITHLGGEFLAGRASIPLKVKTFRNKIEEKTPETQDIHDVMRKDQSWPQTFEYEIMERR